MSRYLETIYFSTVYSVDWLLVSPEDVVYSVTKAVEYDNAVAMPPPYIGTLYWLLAVFPPELLHFLTDIGPFRHILHRILNTVGINEDCSI